MLHILLVILKILGIILACLLGLLLLLILIVLFVPIRYRLDAKKREELIIKMRVSWLLRIVFVRIWFINKQLHIKLRIFGFTLWDNLRPKKEKKVKKNKTKSSKKKSRVKERDKKESTSKKTTSVSLPDEISSKKTSSVSLPEESTSKKTSSVNLSKESPELVIDKKKVLDEHSDSQAQSTDDEIKKVEDLPSRLDKAQEKDKESHEYSIETQKNAEKENGENTDKENGENAEKENEENADKGIGKLQKLSGKLKKIVDKIKGFFKKLSKLGTTIKDKFNKILELIKKVFEKKNLVSVFLKDELNQAGIKLALGQLLELLRYSGPQKIEGYLKFGTGDPESTGKLLGAVAFLYGYYGKSVTIEPDFENKVFEAEGMVKGRIRIIRLLIISIKVIRDKNFKKLVKNARQLKEEL